MLATSNGLEPDMFASDGHKYIWMAINYLISEGKELDPISVINVFTDDRAKEKIDELGGVDYIEQMKASPVAPNTALFVSHIIQADARRAIYVASERAKERALKHIDEDINDMLMDTEASFRDVSISYQVAQDVKKIGDGVSDRLKDRLLNPRDVIGFKTGFETFDRMTQGLQDGKLYVIGARSGVGKSVTMANWIKKICIEDGIPVLNIDTEMDTDEQQDRYLSMISGVPEEEIKNGMFGKDTMNGLAKDKITKVQEASKKLKEAPLYHVYMPHFTPEKIMALCRKYQIEHGVQLIFFDYIKLPSSSSSGNDKEHQAIGYLTSSLKDMAGMLKVPVVAGVQLNRSAVGQEEYDAGMIADSDRIIRLVDTMCFLRWKTEEERAMSAGNQRFKIDKQRGGAGNTDWFDIDYKGHILTQTEVKTT